MRISRSRRTACCSPSAVGTRRSRMNVRQTRNSSRSAHRPVELMAVALQRTLPERTVHVHVDDRAIDVENCECSQFSDFIGPEPEDLRCDLGQTDTRRQSEKWPDHASRVLRACIRCKGYRDADKERDHEKVGAPTPGAVGRAPDTPATAKTEPHGRLPPSAGGRTSL